MKIPQILTLIPDFDVNPKLRSWDPYNLESSFFTLILEDSLLHKKPRIMHKKNRALKNKTLLRG